jgi:hypothetical protein
MYKSPLYILLLFLCWLVASSWFYVTKIKDAYPNKLALAENRYPFFFKYSDSNVLKGTNFDSFKALMLQKLEPNNRILITGNYSVNEYNNTSYPNLGIARAKSVAQLFNDLDDHRILLNSQNTDSTFENNFKSIQWLDAVEVSVLMNNDLLQEMAYGAKINFNEGLDHPKIQAYLKYISIENIEHQINLAEISNQETDSFSSNCSFIKSQLIMNGVDSSYINILPMIVDSTQTPHLEVYINQLESNEY